MNNKLYKVFGIIMIFISLSASLKNDNGRAGYTGSPGEATCNTTSCHTSFVLNSGGGSLSATSTMNNWVYVPLNTYTINIKVAQSAFSLFGFGVELLTSSNNNAGTIIVTDPVHTIIKSRSVGGVLRKNIVHQLNGGAFQDSVVFSFNWTAPDSSIGDITMYFVGNASNKNNDVSGDYIYSSTQLISPSAGNGLSTFVDIDPLSVYPNPASTKIYLHFNLVKKENICVKLYNLDGRNSHILFNDDRNAGENIELILLPPNCRSGLYLLTIESASGRESRKLMIN